MVCWATFKDQEHLFAPLLHQIELSSFLLALAACPSSDPQVWVLALVVCSLLVCVSHLDIRVAPFWYLVILLPGFRTSFHSGTPGT